MNGHEPGPKIEKLQGRTYKPISKAICPQKVDTNKRLVSTGFSQEKIKEGKNGLMHSQGPNLFGAIQNGMIARPKF